MSLKITDLTAITSQQGLTTSLPVSVSNTDATTYRMTTKQIGQLTNGISTSVSLASLGNTTNYAVPDTGSVTQTTVNWSNQLWQDTAVGATSIAPAMWTAGGNASVIGSGQYLYVPTGAARIKLSAQIHWITNGVGVISTPSNATVGARVMKITDGYNNYAGATIASVDGTMLYEYTTANTGIIDLAAWGNPTRFNVKVQQDSGSTQYLWGTQTNWFTLEVVTWA
jgi:hypothetical protein